MDAQMVLEAIREGARVSRRDIALAIRTLEERRRQYMDMDLAAGGLIDSITANIEELQGYKPRKTSVPRAKVEIQADIDAALALKRGAEIARQYKSAAIYAHTLAEYEREFDAALLGHVYRPRIEDQPERMRQAVYQQNMSV